MKNISVKLLGPVVQEMPFKDISDLQLWWPICSAEWNQLCDFGRGNHKKYFCENYRVRTSG